MIGCYAPSIPAGGACTTACPGEQVCVAGTCRDPGDIDPPIDGSPAVDTDGDGLFDDRDNCIARANVDQHDEDADGAGDACDPCPHVAATGAAAAFIDTDGDGVGDACDPQPAVKAQQWVLFDPFVTKRPEWSSSNDAVFASDEMTLEGYIRLNIANGELRIAVGGRFSDLGPVPRQHVLERAMHSDGSYYYAEAYEDDAKAYVKLTKYNGTNYLGIVGHDFPSSIPTGPFTWVIDESVSAQTMGFTAQHAGVAYPRVQTATTAPQLEATGSLLFGTKSMRATYDYVAVIRTLP
jgi:Thrombospondin type 3 repeat